MTISELTLKLNDLEPVRRFEVFTGSGRRREWPPEEKARIVAESYVAGDFVLSLADMRFPRSNCLPGAGLRVSPRRRRRHQNPCSFLRWLERPCRNRWRSAQDDHGSRRRSATLA